VLFVCHNNTCRSPMARVVAQALADADGGGAFAFAAAGTHATGGERIDPRAAEALAGHGFAADRVRSRRLTPDDLATFDLVIAMDDANLAELARLRDPIDGRQRLLLDFVPGERGRSVPDPYYGDRAGFDHALGLCITGCRGLLAALRAH
jgi:protein-tyrosine phosphatase